MMDDTDLLRAYAETRSETAFAEFARRRVGFVYATALRMVAGDAHTAQDIAQAVFVLAANKSPALAKHERLAGWLHMATCNIARQTLRETRRRATHEQEAARMNAIENETANSGGAGNASLEICEELRPLLDDALCALREGEREAVLLRYFEGKAFSEIGAKLKTSGDTAQKRVTRAIEKMRAAFAKRGVTSSAAALSALMTAEAAQVAPAGLAASVSAGAITSATVAAAAAGASAASAGAILAFMSSAKITTAAIVAISVAAGGVFYGVHNERASAASLAQARLENKNLAEQLRALEKQNAAASAPASAPKRTPLEAGQALLAEHPEIKEKILALDKANGMAGIFRIAKELNLSPEQIDQLAEIWGRRSAVTTYKVPEYGDVKFDIISARPKSDMAEIRALLGDADYEKFQHLRDLDYGGICQSKELSTRLYLTDEPLTSQQAWAIDEISLDLSRNFRKDTEPEALWKMFQERAKSILSPGQMKAFAELGDKYISLRTMTNGLVADREATAAKSKTTKAKKTKSK